MRENLEKLFSGYIENVVKPLCNRFFATEKEEHHAWNLETFGFFHKKGNEHFRSLGLGESDYEIRSSWRKLIEPEKYMNFQNRYGDKADDWFMGEYLVDLSWRGWGEFGYRTELAMEVEWEPIPLNKDWGEPAGEEDFDEDLYKLLDLRSPMKMGILGCGKDPKNFFKTADQEDLVQQFADYVRAGDHAGEDFLLVFVDNPNTGGVSGYIIDEEGDHRLLGRYAYDEMKAI
jgi:hypothetical protein